MYTVRALVCISLFFLCSCSSTSLTVRSQNFDRTQLASYIIDTPDPQKNNPPFGERLIISWSASMKDYTKDHLDLVLRIRFRKGKELEKTIHLTQRNGSLIYPILGKEYIENGGVMSYLITLESDGKVIGQSKHKMWVDKIRPSSKSKQGNADGKAI